MIKIKDRRIFYKSTASLSPPRSKLTFIVSPAVTSPTIVSELSRKKQNSGQGFSSRCLEMFESTFGIYDFIKLLLLFFSL